MSTDQRMNSEDYILEIDLTSNATFRRRGPPKKIYICPLCEKPLIGMSMYTYHRKHVHRESCLKRGAKMRNYLCSVCNVQLPGFYVYKLHMKNIHHKNAYHNSDGTLFKCPEPACEVKIRRSHLSAHLGKIHNTTLKKLSPYWCKSCGKVFKRFLNLIHHQKTVHGGEVSQIKNSEEKEHVAKPQIKNSIKDSQHVARISARRSQAPTFSHEPLPCSECNKCFFSTSSLIRHKKICLGVNESLKCSQYPPATFPLNCIRTKHKNEVRPNPIVLPRRSPRTRASRGSEYTDLRNIEQLESADSSDHLAENRTPGGILLIHADDLYCSYCPKKFSNSGSKMLHEKIHTGDWSYVCKSCNASFRLERTLLDHKKKCSTSVDVMWCRFCNFSSESRSKLEAHYENMHGFDLNAYETLWGEEDDSKFSGNVRTPQENDTNRNPDCNVTVEIEEVRATISINEDDPWSQFNI